MEPCAGEGEARLHRAGGGLRSERGAVPPAGTVDAGRELELVAAEPVLAGDRPAVGSHLCSLTGRNADRIASARVFRAL